MSTKTKNSILLIEDDKQLAYFINACLTRNGFDVVTTHNGKTGLRIFMEGGFDLLIVDIGLPGINGMELISRIRAKHLGVPIIVITTQTESSTELKSFTSGANLFHKKPINYELLIAQVSSILHANQTQPHKIYKLGNIKIDPERRLITYLNQNIVLTNSEFDLILNLVTSQGKVFGRNEIITKILKNRESEISAVDTLVSRLRKKLASFTDEEIIETVPKSGYRIHYKYILPKSRR